MGSHAATGGYGARDLSRAGGREKNKGAFHRAHTLMRPMLLFALPLSLPLHICKEPPHDPRDGASDNE